ncbi:ciliary microtubule inner protein 4 [Phalacrocorax aristotelis]|uniref:ciliary microtubule inner protein 4 n=1 Tax=Phalacrocorax aristotelis TaxID=126867 RepID=UPI003F4BA54B
MGVGLFPGNCLCFSMHGLQQDLPAATNHYGTTSGIMDQDVVQVPASPTPDVAESGPVLANTTSMEPEEERKEHPSEGLYPSRQRTSQRSSSRASWKTSKGPVAQGTAKNSTSVKRQASPSAKCVQTKRQSKQSLQAKTALMQGLRSRRIEEERQDTSATKDLTVGHEPRGMNSTYYLSAISRQRGAEGTKSVSNAKEPVAGQHQTVGSRGPESSQKTIKASHKKAKETCSRISAKESLASLGPDMKAERKLLLEKRNHLIHGNSKYKFASADELTSNEEDRQALCKAALVMGQKRLSDRTEMLKNSPNSKSFADCDQLGFNLRSNIFQGGPLESRSLMKDSYTPDIIQKAIRDPKNWHGRRTDELGKWHQKNALDLNLQKALEDKYGKKKDKP